MKNDEVKKIISLPSFSWLSLHLGLPVKSFIFDDNQDFVATSQPISKKEFFEKVSKNLQEIKKLYPKNKFILPKAKNTQAVVLEAQGLHSAETMIDELKSIREAINTRTQ